MDNEKWLEKVIDEFVEAKKTGKEININSRLKEFIDQFQELYKEISGWRYGVL